MPKNVISPPLYTKSLILISVNVFVISLLFTVYDVRIPVKETSIWALHRLYKIPRVRSVVDSIRSFIGLAKLTFPKQEIRSTAKPPPPKLGNKLNSKSNNESVYKSVLDLKVFTSEQLSLFDGSRPSKPIYLAILGRIYDVEKGRKHYSTGGSYHFLAGKDATRAFVTGDFTKDGLTDNIEGFGDTELLSILDWISFYDKEYQLVGVVNGRFYDEDGELTSEGIMVNESLERALGFREKQVKETEVFPPCNSEWNKENGGRVWCTAKSGGVKREWVGVPRRLFTPGSRNYRCACVKNFGPPIASPDTEGNRGDLDHPQLEEYPNCSPVANSCRLEPEK